MKLFLYKVAVFLLPAVLLLYPLDMLISHSLLRSGSFAEGEYLVWNDIKQGSVNAQLLIYGSSRAWVQFSAAILQDSLGLSAYNMGIDGHNFGLQYFRHTEFLRGNPKPEIIIQEVDIFSLQKRPDLYNYAQFLPYMLWNKEIRRNTSSYAGFSSWDFYAPLIRYCVEYEAFAESIKQLCCAKSSPPSRHLGYRGINLAWSNDLALARSKMDSYEVVPDTATCVLFDTFLAECRENGIRVVLVYPPEYIEGQQFVKNRAEVIDRYRHIARRHELLFLDYSDDSLCFDKQYFYNALHLNKRGSELFTATLAHDLKKYAVCNVKVPE